MSKLISYVLGDHLACFLVAFALGMFFQHHYGVALKIW